MCVCVCVCVCVCMCGQLVDIQQNHRRKLSQPKERDAAATIEKNIGQEESRPALQNSNAD